MKNEVTRCGGGHRGIRGIRGIGGIGGIGETGELGELGELGEQVGLALFVPAILAFRAKKTATN
jgi:hypothetical protein